MNGAPYSLQKTKIASKRDKDDIRLSFLISMSVLFVYILNLFDGFSYLFNVDVSVLSNILKGILAVIFIARITIIKRRFNVLIFMVVLITGIVIFANILFFPQNNVYFKNYAINFVLIHLPLMIYISAIVNYKYLIESMIKVSYFIAVLSIISFISSVLILKVSFNDGQYLMGFSYSMVLPSIILARNYIRTEKIKNLLLLLSMIIIILSYGARGPVICIAVYFLIEVFRKNFYENKKYYKILFIPIVVILFLLLYKPILILINDMLVNLNIYSRTIQLFLSSNPQASPGRSLIYQIVWDDFVKNPIAIRGINADFLLGVGYSHNIFLELLYQFGLILGLPMILIILYFTIKTIFSFNQEYIGEYIRIVFSASIPSLLVSHTLWDYMAFWMWFILCIKLSSKRKTFKKNNNLVRRRTAGY